MIIEMEKWCFGLFSSLHWVKDLRSHLLGMRDFNSNAFNLSKVGNLTCVTQALHKLTSVHLTFVPCVGTFCFFMCQCQQHLEQSPQEQARRRSTIGWSAPKQSHMTGRGALASSRLAPTWVSAWNSLLHTGHIQGDDTGNRSARQCPAFPLFRKHDPSWTKRQKDFKPQLMMVSLPLASVQFLALKTRVELLRKVTNYFQIRTTPEKIQGSVTPSRYQVKRCKTYRFEC